MDGKKIISRLKRLDEVETIKDVQQLTHTLFPGSHCPLMGAALVAKGIKDAMIMVIGTDECAYYTKSLTLNPDFGGIKGRCVSVVVDTHDVTFGSAKTTEVAFDEMIKEYDPKCVFLVTTCVIEIIGDDMDAVAAALTDKYNLPVMAVHTEHFKCQDHMPGIERTITACAEMMEDQDKGKQVNVLGQRLGIFENTELYSVLKNAGVEVGLMLPSGCTVDDIKKAPSAQVNIVVHDTALPLAKKMEKEFGVPYVNFVRFANLESILDNYKNLFNYLNVELPQQVVENYEATQDEMKEAKKALDGVTYIYGHTPFVPFEINAFMISLGMEPLLIQVSHLDGIETWKQEILKTHNPFTTKSANITPLQYVYDELKPDLYLGHEYANKLRAKGIALVHTDRANQMLGFDATRFIVNALVNSAALAKSYQSGEMPESAGMPMPMGGGMGAMMGGGHPAGVPKHGGGGHPAGIPKHGGGGHPAGIPKHTGGGRPHGTM
ncbi:MAG: hypothetical protein ATN35_04845 [Epulopiscium sp. Nele67-Bin004]|nr:MAG: hypothetical protein ATN35_04845 [Epulopiscium sp. Nele67-Bin004]